MFILVRKITSDVLSLLQIVNLQIYIFIYVKQFYIFSVSFWIMPSTSFHFWHSGLWSYKLFIPQAFKSLVMIVQ